MTNVRSRFNDWMFKVLFFLVPFLFVPLLSSRVDAADLSKAKDIVLSSENFVYNGSLQKPTLTSLKDENDVAIDVGEVKLSFKDADGNAVAAPTNAGIYTVVIENGDKGTHINTNEEKTFTITAKALTKDMVSGIENVIYDGADKTPTVTVQDDGNILIAGKNYTVEYKDASGNALTGEIKDAQTVTVIVTGQGNYTGDITETFTITAKTLTEEMVSDIENVTYDGTDKTPTVVVKDGTTELTATGANPDYEVKYYKEDGTTELVSGQIIDAQKVKVKITGKGNYSGEITKDFTIQPVELKPGYFKDIADQTYTGSAIKPTITSVDGQVIVTSKDAEITYTDNINVGTATVTITGKGNATGTAEKTFKIVPVELKSDYFNNIADQTYTGSEIKPTITSKDGKEVTDSKDGTIAYTNNINVGTATVTITGKGNATGTAEKTFKIVAKPLTDNSITVTGLSDQSYSGTAKEPAVVVKDGANVLTENTHYTVSYESNTNVGTAKVTITGKGNYTGSKTVNFEIVPGSVTFENLSASNIVYGQTLSESKITGTAKDPAGNKVEGTFSFADPSFKPELADIANPKGFTQEVEIKFVSSDGNYEGTDNIKLEVQYWGKPVLNDGIMNWVDSNGTTSVQVKESGISWLKEDSDESSAWYGIENPLDSTDKPVFTPGSRFWVRWLSKSDSDWNKYYDQIDNDYKAQVDNNQLWIFLTGVTAPDGTEYKNFGTTANLYIQIGADWDERDIKSVCVLDAKDEAVDSSFIESSSLTDCPVDGKLAKLSLTHFSVYGVAPYDSKSSGSNFDDYLSDLAKELGLDTYSTGSSSKGTSSSGTTSSSGLSSLYKTTGETDEENAYLIPMLLPILLFVLIYEKKRLNKVL